MNSLRTSARSGTRGYAHLVEIDVPIERVWRAVTEPASVRFWSGEEVEIDARKGGVYRIGKRHTGGREAHIDIFDPSRRLRLIYFNGPEMPSSASAVVDDILFDVRKEGTSSVRVLGSGVPETPQWDKAYTRLRLMWERYLGRLKCLLETPPPKKVQSPPKDPPLPGLDY